LDADQELRELLGRIEPAFDHEPQVRQNDPARRAWNEWRRRDSEYRMHGSRRLNGAMMRTEQIAGENGPLIADRDRCRLIAGLPPTEIRRWSFRRKAAVILGVRAGLLSPQQACGRYVISPEELAAWETTFDRNGIPGLRSTRIQIYRHAPLKEGVIQANSASSSSRSLFMPKGARSSRSSPARFNSVVAKRSVDLRMSGRGFGA
jgi:hypothetical protein